MGRFRLSAAAVAYTVGMSSETLTARESDEAMADRDLPGYCRALGERARAAGLELANTPGSARRAALVAMAEAVAARRGALQERNGLDLAAGRENGLSAALLDRLELTDARLGAIVDSIHQIAEQPDPVGEVIEGRVLPNGVRLEKRRVPLGVFLMIYESRPNVTTDAAALALKSGNAVILRGGKEARHTNAALADCVRTGVASAGLPEGAVQFVATSDRAAVGELLRLSEFIDVAIPRGGESLIRAVVEQAHIPVIKHYTGNCHTYIHADADPAMAFDLAVNAKMQRTGVCNATETFLVHRDFAAEHLGTLCARLIEAGCALRGDATVRAACGEASEATEADWGREYLGPTAAMAVVDSLDAAVAHINRYGSRHTDAIVTASLAAADRFVNTVDTANCFVNCSTRFSDGGQYGLGAEIGISTDTLHARGPMGAADLTTYKWVALGSGQLRT